MDVVHLLLGGKLTLDLLQSVPEAWPTNARQMDHPFFSNEEARVDRGFGARGPGIKLHAVRLDSHDGPRVGRKKDMGDLSYHGVREVLHHERHAVSFCPSEAQESASLSLAGLQRDASPAQRPSEHDLTPVVGAFIHEERLSRRNRVDIDLVFFQLVREWLLDVEDRPVNSRLFLEEAVENGIDVLGLGDGAVEIGG